MAFIRVRIFVILPLIQASTPSAMNKEDVTAQFPALLPLAVEWAARQERWILREGVGLTAEEIDRKSTRLNSSH